MSVDPRDPVDPFTERIARRLRAEERFDDDFERTLVEAIREDRPIERHIAARRRPLSPAWWSAPSLRMSPLAGLAAAASIAALVSLGTLTLVAPPAMVAPVAVASARDTVTFVRFVFVGDAKSVALVGDFNAWAPTPLSATGPNGAWTASVPLANGRHEYAFIVDGKKWMPDQFAPASSDEFDATSSVITIGD
jgi:hypothetical protein